MARNRIEIEATPEEVFEVLLDAKSYARWVVGAKEVRDVDPSWPEKGAALHHSMGGEAATVDDRTEILEIRPPELLKLRAYARPLGIADVTIAVSQNSGGCEFVLEESPSPGTKVAKVAPLVDPLIYLRNIGSVRRFRKLVLARAAK